MLSEVSQIATIEFRDQDSGDEAVAIVRGGPDAIGLALSLRKDGDIEVFFGPAEAARLVDALQKALAGARRA